MSTSPVLRRGEAIAGRFARKSWMERAARVGLVSRAVNYTALAVLVTAILLGRRETEVDRRGAIEAIAAAPLGRVLLVLLSAGFAAYIAWQLMRAATRRHDESGTANTGRRLLALGTAILYAGFLFTALRVLIGASTSSPQGEQQSWTASLLATTGGRVVVAAAGLAFIGAGLGLGAYAASRKFETPLDTGAMGPAMRRVATVLGVAGQAARGLVFMIIGGFILSAALADDANRSKGLDASLKTLAGQPFGAVMLAVVAVGFLAFGLYSLLDARYRKDFSR